MRTLEQGPAAVTVLSRMAGFLLYENVIYNLSMQYPSSWNKQEILLNNDHNDLEVMFIAPIAARFSKVEDSKTILKKIRDIMYNQPYTVVVLSLKRLPAHETYTLQAVTSDHIRKLQICFDNINILERGVV
jgi:hypothetical protein